MKINFKLLQNIEIPQNLFSEFVTFEKDPMIIVKNNKEFTDIYITKVFLNKKLDIMLQFKSKGIKSTFKLGTITNTIEVSKIMEIIREISIYLLHKYIKVSKLQSLNICK